MRSFKGAILAVVGPIFLAAGAVAQTPPATTSTGVPADFAASASARLNSYRAMAKLPPVVDDPVISAAAYDHARYLVKNGIGGADVLLQKQQLRFRLQTDAARSEIKGQPFYTDEGAAAAMNAVNLTAPEINLSGAEFVDLAMTMPFHGLIPMTPQFALVGLGAYCDPGQCAIVIPGRYGLEKPVRLALYDGPASDRLWNPGLGLIPAETGRLKSPVEFPPDGATVVLNSYSGHDYPDPLPSCPEYKAPTGAPISIQLGEGYGPDGSLEVSSHLVSRDGVEIETCLVTTASYNGHDAMETKIGKMALTQIGAAIIMPRQPLAPGHYKVALKEAEKLYEWSFTVAAPASAGTSPTR